MTPPLGAGHNARCGRSSIFPEQGDRSHPALAVWQGGGHALPGAGMCGSVSRLGGHLERPLGGSGAG